MDEGTFTGLGVSRPVADALAERGIKVPFAIQARVIPDGLAGRDVLAQSPTGSGKTLAFGVPLVERLTTDDDPACGARARADPRARHTGCRGAVGSGEGARARRLRRLRRRAAPLSGEAGAEGARSSSPRPVGSGI